MTLNKKAAPAKAAAAAAPATTAKSEVATSEVATSEVAPKGVGSKTGVLSLNFGPDATENGDGAQVLVALGFPLVVSIANLMPRPVAFPELQGLHLAHCAGLPELTTKNVTFRNVDQLHRFVTDVQGLCEFNSFKKGVTVETVEVVEAV